MPKIKNPEMDKLNDDNALVQAILKLGRLTLLFSRVNRGVPVDETGTPESDTDHTIMVSLVACCVASRYKPALDPPACIPSYSYHHSALPQDRALERTARSSRDPVAKREREEEARAKLKVNHRFFPWLADTVARYEALADPEARFVKAIDKAMPAVLHNLNGGLIFKRGQPKFQRPAELQDAVRGRDKYLRDHDWARDQDFPLGVRELLMERVIRRQWKRYGIDEGATGCNSALQPSSRPRKVRAKSKGRARAARG